MVSAAVCVYGGGEEFFLGSRNEGQIIGDGRGDIFLHIANNVHERPLSLASWMGLDTAAILDFLRKNLNNMDAYFEL